jgi:hypothetical protein
VEAQTVRRIGLGQARATVGLVIFLAAVWILLLTTVVLDFAGIWRRPTAWRWQGTGLLISNGVVLVNSYANARGGPYPRTPLHSFTWPVLLAGLALLVIGLVVQARGLAVNGRPGSGE